MSVVGTLGLVFDAADRQPVAPLVVQAMLGKFGEYIGRSNGTVRLVRV